MARVLLALAPAAGCATVPPELVCRPASPMPMAGYVEVRFLGGAGFLITRPRKGASGGADVVLTPPLYSNPGFVEAGIGRVAAHLARIERGLERFASPLPLSADAIVVGHAHYDHLMDVPAIWDLAPTPKPVVYGNQSAQAIMSLATPAVPVVSMEADAVAFDDADPDKKWKTLAEDRVRILAIRSDHSPQFMRYKLQDTGTWASPAPMPRRLPDNTCDWRPGQVLAYLIDFLDDKGGVEFRIHYADSPSNLACALVPRNLDGGPGGARRAVDLALLNGGGADGFPAYPWNLLDNTCAAEAVVGHWEDFFREYRDPLPRMLPGVRRVVREARARLGDTKACLPPRGQPLRYPIVAARPCPRETIAPQRCPWMCRSSDSDCGTPSPRPAPAPTP